MDSHGLSSQSHSYLYIFYIVGQKSRIGVDRDAIRKRVFNEFLTLASKLGEDTRIENQVVLPL